MHLSTLSTTNKRAITTFENPIVKYTIVVAIAIYIIFIGKISDGALSIFDTLWCRVLLALIIAWTACFDPVYSIMIAGTLILSIMELHRRRSIVGMQRQHSVIVPPNVIGNRTMRSIPKDIAMTDKLVFDEINKHSLQKSPEGDDSILAEYDYYYDPAYTNLTQNVREQNILRNGSFYVTSDELTAAQSNGAIGSSTGAMTGLPGSLNAQGMNTIIPSGYDREMSSLDSKDLTG